MRETESGWKRNSGGATNSRFEPDSRSSHGLADTVPSVIGDADKFAGQVVDTRNYLTHYDPELKNRAASGTELSKITEKLKIVLQICLIRELGLNESTIRFLLMKNWTFQQRLDWLK